MSECGSSHGGHVSGGGGDSLLVELLGFLRFLRFGFLLGGGLLLDSLCGSLGSLGGSLSLRRLHLRGVDRLLVLLLALGKLLLDLFSFLVKLGFLRDEHLEVRRSLIRRTRLGLLNLLLGLSRRLSLLLETVHVLARFTSPVNRLEFGRGALFLLGALEVNSLRRIRLRHLSLNLGNLGGRRGSVGAKLGARRTSALDRLKLSRGPVLLLGSLEGYLLLNRARGGCRANLGFLGSGLGSRGRSLGGELLRLELRHPGASLATSLHGLQLDGRLLLVLGAGDLPGLALSLGGK